MPAGPNSVRPMGPFVPPGPVQTGNPEVLERMLKRDEPHEEKKLQTRNKKPRAKKSKPNPGKPMAGQGPPGGPPVPGQVPPGPTRCNLPPNEIPPVHPKAVSHLITHGHPYSPVRSYPPFAPPNHGPFPGHYRGARPVNPDGSAPPPPQQQQAPPQRVVISNRPSGPHIRPMTQMRLISNGTNLIPITDNQIVTGCAIPVVPFSSNGTNQVPTSPQPVMSPVPIPMEAHSPSPIVLAPHTPPPTQQATPPPVVTPPSTPPENPGAQPSQPRGGVLANENDELHEILNNGTNDCNQPTNQQSPFVTNQQEDMAKQNILNFLLSNTETPPISSFNFDQPSSSPSSSTVVSVCSATSNSNSTTATAAAVMATSQVQSPVPSSPVSSPGGNGGNHANNNQNNDSATVQVFKVPLPPKPKNSVS